MTNCRADATSTSRFVMLLKIELDAAGANGDRGSDREADANLSSLPAAMITRGWRQRVPDVGGSFSRRETVYMASEMRKSSGDCEVGVGRKSKVCCGGLRLEGDGGKVFSVSGRRLESILGNSR